MYKSTYKTQILEGRSYAEIKLFEVVSNVTSFNQPESFISA